MTDKKYSLAEWAGITLGTPVIILLAMVVSLPFSLFYAYIRIKLWNWFFAPYFHLNPIGIGTMIGFGILLDALQPVRKGSDNDYGPWHKIGLTVVAHLFALVAGYLVHTYLVRWM